MNERIILIGFMGTGKTTVGEALAAELGYSLIDCDHELVAREGRTIPEIFAGDGETYFRQRETEVLSDLARRERVVITTGGGAVLSAENRRLMAEAGFVVALTAEVEEIVRRVAADQNRPLLQAEDETALRSRVETLIESRRGLYEFAAHTVDTTGRDIGEIVEQITRALSVRPS